MNFAPLSPYRGPSGRESAMRMLFTIPGVLSRKAQQRAPHQRTKEEHRRVNTRAAIERLRAHVEDGACSTRPRSEDKSNIVAHNPSACSENRRMAVCTPKSSHKLCTFLSQICCAWGQRPVHGLTRILHCS